LKVAVMMRVVSILFVVFVGAPLRAGPIELVIDQTRSSASTELCLTVLSTACDTDTSPLAGTITLSLDCPSAPGEITLHDFALQMVDDIGFVLDYGALGQFNGTGQDITLHYADPANPLPPVPLSDDTFVYLDIPALAAGQLDYETTGALCLAFNLAGYECVDAIDLTTIELDPLDIDGSIGVSGSEVDVVLDTIIAGPVDPDNPDLGSMSISVRIVASGTVPPPCCPGDLTGDDRVELVDGVRLIACLAGPNGGVEGPCQCADLDADSDVDLRDFADFQSLLEGL